MVRGRQKKRQRARSGLLAAVSVCLLSTGLAHAAAPPQSMPRPATRIPVDPLGFVPPARFFMPYRVPAATLDFLDPTHLLFTFHVARLMRREADASKDDQDQTVRAVVLSVPSGKIESEGDWRLHDRERYLWMLDDGHFLLRKRDTLYIGDKTLVLKDYLHPEGALASVQLSPDTSTLVAQFANPVQTGDDADGRPAGAPTLGPSTSGAAGPSMAGDDAPRFPEKLKDYTILVVDTRGRTAKRVGHMPRAVVLPMVQGGYLGVHQGNGKQWDVELNPFSGDSHVVTSVASTCQPVLQAVSQEAFLTQSCLPYSADHLVDAFDLHGRKLWEQVWQSRFTWGTFAYAAAGNRFAYGSVEVNHPLATLDPVDEASIVGQPVGIFSVETGKLDTVLDANPILTAGENFTLSPDGDKLAILRNGAIEVYDFAPIQSASAQAAPVSPATRH